MGADRDAMLEKVRKLMAKAEDKGASPAESANFMAAALRLMTQYSLDEMEVRRKDEKVDWSFKEVRTFGRWTTLEQFAYGICITFYNVHGVISDTNIPGRKRAKVIKFFGEPYNVDIAGFMFNSLLNAFDNLWATYRLKTKCEAKERLIYLTGVTEGYKQKLKSEMVDLARERDETRGENYTALQLISAKDKMMQAFREQNIQTKQVVRKFVKRDGSIDSLNAGINDGRNLNLNRAIGGDSQKKIGKQG